MVLKLSTSPSDILVQLVGNIDSTTVAPTVRLKPVSALKIQVDNTPANDTLITESVFTLSADVTSGGVLQSERFYLTGGTETTFNGESVVEYATTVRGIFNTDDTNPPTSANGGDRNYKEHSNGATTVLDGGFLARQLETAFDNNVANRGFQSVIYLPTTDVAVGDDRGRWEVFEKYDGDTATKAYASVAVAGTTGDTTIQIHNLTTGNDMLSTPITIASGATQGSGVIDATYEIVSSHDILRIDVDSVASTAPTGLIVSLELEN